MKSSLLAWEIRDFFENHWISSCRLKLLTIRNIVIVMYAAWRYSAFVNRFDSETVFKGLRFKMTNPDELQDPIHSNIRLQYCIHCTRYSLASESIHSFDDPAIAVEHSRSPGSNRLDSLSPCSLCIHELTLHFALSRDPGNAHSGASVVTRASFLTPVDRGQLVLTFGSGSRQYS